MRKVDCGRPKSDHNKKPLHSISNNRHHANVKTTTKLTRLNNDNERIFEQILSNVAWYG